MNAGYEIIDIVPTGLDEGYVIGCNGKSYATWWVTQRAWGFDFYHGHYFNIDWTMPDKTRAQARADLYDRVSKDYAFKAK